MKLPLGVKSLQRYCCGHQSESNMLLEVGEALEKEESGAEVQVQISLGP